MTNGINTMTEGMKDSIRPQGSVRSARPVHSDGDRIQIKLKVVLGLDEWSRIDTLSKEVMLKGVRIHKHRARIGITSICHALFDCLLADGELQRKLGEGLIEKGRLKDNADNAAGVDASAVIGADVKLLLTVSKWSKLDKVVNGIQQTGMKVLKRRFKVSTIRICSYLLEVYLTDNLLQKNVEERLLEKLKTK